MIRLLIVDDEKVTRESLKKYIPWEALNIGPVLTARNGIEALAVARRAPPEILLTDVRMPKMDGLELARRVRELYPDCKIVFLSGYADKEYLKTAIRLQAVCYVEKPVDTEELKEAVLTAARAIEKEAGQRSETELLRKSSRDRARLMRSDITRALVMDDAFAKEMRSSFADALPAFEPETFFTAAVVLLHWKGALTEGEKASCRRRVLEACGGLTPFDLASSFLGFVETDVLALVVARRIMEAGQGGRGAYDGLLARLRALADGAFIPAVAVGDAVAGLGSIPRSYLSALRSASLSFYRGCDAVLFPAVGRAESFSAEPGTFCRFRACLRDHDPEHACELVQGISESARDKEPRDVDSVRDVFFKLYMVLFETGLTAGTADPLRGGDRAYIWRELRERQTLAELTGYVQGLVHEACSTPVDASFRKMRNVQRYLRDNFSDPSLDLRVLAERTGLSKSYICAQFRKATGRHINGYVTELRMEKAKELLRGGNMNASEVAARVGYRKLSYFSALFKKRVGRTPTEYRNAT